MKFQDGDIYTGSWETNMMNGSGSMVSSENHFAFF